MRTLQKGLATPLNKGQTFYYDCGVEYFARGRTQQMFIRGDSAPRSNPTPYPFIYHFSRKRYSFRIPSAGKWYPFYITCLELCIPENALSYHKNRTFSRIFRAIKFICSPFWDLLQTQMTDSPTLLYTSTSEITCPFWAEPPRTWV